MVTTALGSIYTKQISKNFKRWCDIIILLYLPEANGTYVLGVGGGRGGRLPLARLRAALGAAHALHHLRSRKRT